MATTKDQLSEPGMSVSDKRAELREYILKVIVAQAEELNLVGDRQKFDTPDCLAVPGEVDEMIHALDQRIAVAALYGFVRYDPVIFTEQGLWYPERELETSGTDSQLASD